MRHFLSLLFLLLSLNVLGQNETTIFDVSGNATHYIENSTGILYSFEGVPIAFLKPKPTYFNIYNYRGEHLGWFENGIVRDHKGDIVVFVKGAVTNVMTRFEPSKGLKRFEPTRPFEKNEPFKPSYSTIFSRTPLSYFFGDNSSNNSNSENNRQQYVPEIEPFSPDFNMMGNVLSKLQARHDKLTSQGYFYDVETEQYLSPQEFPTIKKNRITALKNVLQIWSNSKYNKQNMKVKDGKYNVYYLRSCLS